MSFKRKLISICLTGVFAIVVGVASMVAIFANNNMLVKTNVMLTYTGSMTGATITINKWKEGETSRTTLLASTSASGITEEVVNSVTEELTENVTYFVLEYIVVNSSLSDYYAQFTYTDADSDDSNIKFRWCVSVGSQLATSTLLQNTLEEEYLYWKGNTTQIINNLTIAKKGTNTSAKTTYIYIICGIEDVSQHAKFTGSLNWNVSIMPFEESEQINVFKDGNYYYTYLGRMPQTYAGKTLTGAKLLNEVYTENGVDYPIYANGFGIKYVKKDEAYYKYERIKWQVLGKYEYSSQNNSNSSFTAYSATNYADKSSSNLILISTKILFKSQWNESLTRVNYPDSTVHTRISDFYNNILSKYDTRIGSNLTYCNNVTGSRQSELADQYATNQTSTSTLRNVWLFTTLQATKWFNAEPKRQTYSTAWANGTTTEQLDSWWLRTNQYNVVDEVEIFKANSVGADGVVVGADITETKGVRPAIVANLT